MNKTEYIQLKQQLSFDKPVWAILVTVLAQSSVCLLAFLLLSQGNLFPFIMSQFLFALFFFHCFAMLHEAGHGNLHKNRWVNSCLGHLFSIGCFMPFFAWKHMHQGHHLWAGSINKDPGSRMLLKLKTLRRVPLLYELCWRLWLPLPAIAQHMRLWFYSYISYKENPSNSRLIVSCAFSTFFLVTSYIVLHQLFPAIITFGNFGIAIFLYFLLTELINLPHHVSMPHFYSTPERDKIPPWQQHAVTRSCRYPGVLSEMVALNFNLHIEHHYFPNLPWYRLKKARALLKARLGSEYVEVTDLGWAIHNRAICAKDVILPDISHPLLNTVT